MTAHVQQASILSGRSMTLMVVIGLHALMIAALIAIQIVPPFTDLGPPPIEVVNVPPEVLPLPPEAKPEASIAPKFPIAVPRLEPIDFDVPLEAEAIAMPTPDSGTVQGDPDIPARSVLAEQPARVLTELKYRAVKSPDEFYPPASAALQEQGIAIVRLCVDGGGRLESQPAIQTSSGYKRLDQAALKWAREALRFTPATENGVGVRSCKGFRVTFNLK